MTLNKATQFHRIKVFPQGLIIKITRNDYFAQTLFALRTSLILRGIDSTMSQKCSSESFVYWHGRWDHGSQPEKRWIASYRLEVSMCFKWKNSNIILPYLHGMVGWRGEMDRDRSFVCDNMGTALVCCAEERPEPKRATLSSIPKTLSMFLRCRSCLKGLNPNTSFLNRVAVLIPLRVEPWPILIGRRGFRHLIGSASWATPLWSFGHIPLGDLSNTEADGGNIYFLVLEQSRIFRT